MVKSFTGKIVSLKMIKTAVVEITRQTRHPLYKKLIKRTKKIKADTGDLTLVLGQTVKITQTRPISKQKSFIVTEVIK